MRPRVPLTPALLGIGLAATVVSILLAGPGSITGLAAAGILGLAIARWMERRGASRGACLATLAFTMLNPLALEANALGHPEEVLGGALCAAVVLAALRGHWAHSGILLGGALATAVALPWTSAADLVGLRAVALAVPLAAAWWCSRSRTPDDALGLLALIFLLPCLLDPSGDAYRHVPFLLCLTAWEGLTRRGLPLVSMLCSVGIALYPLATLPVSVWLAIKLYVPPRVRRRRTSKRPLAARGAA